MGRHETTFVGWALGALLLVSVSACADQAASNGVGGGNPGSVAPTATATATPTAIPTPTPSATPTPTPKPTLAPVQKVAPAPVQPSRAPAPPVQAPSVSFVNGPVSASRGQSANLVVRTSPRTMCSIVVHYMSGPSHAQGLTARSSDGSGIVSWSWIVGTNTTRGQWPITVTCGAASNQTYISVV
jgi:micrococcal nuclease